MHVIDLPELPARAGEHQEGVERDAHRRSLSVPTQGQSPERKRSWIENKGATLSFNLGNTHAEITLPYRRTCSLEVPLDQYVAQAKPSETFDRCPRNVRFVTASLISLYLMVYVLFTLEGPASRGERWLYFIIAAMTLLSFVITVSAALTGDGVDARLSTQVAWGAFRMLLFQVVVPIVMAFSPWSLRGLFGLHTVLAFTFALLPYDSFSAPRKLTSDDDRHCPLCPPMLTARCPYTLRLFVSTWAPILALTASTRAAAGLDEGGKGSALAVMVMSYMQAINMHLALVAIEPSAAFTSLRAIIATVTDIPVSVVLILGYPLPPEEYRLCGSAAFASLVHLFHALVESLVFALFLKPPTVALPPPVAATAAEETGDREIEPHEKDPALGKEGGRRGRASFDSQASTALDETFDGIRNRGSVDSLGALEFTFDKAEETGEAYADYFSPRPPAASVIYGRVGGRLEPVVEEGLRYTNEGMAVTAGDTSFIGRRGV
ncbi:unnamed protein product [Vitrella brassicaformis CCMP3155]|uniref:Uncharacterized protein n=2 Tax=Vitrella brassicaformis TaxID=1169539 RepID=A0A0G4EYT9_VITBC|nr:unnamed protein product [Vitrella brassicaformis CCMP3155]|eukprot:CEM04526.1 unnamed protein product [Vitrella brassicaformis CCMP3155]